MAHLIINPNSTRSMTEAMLAVAQATAPGAGFQGWTSTGAPPAIQGREDGEAATAPLLALVDRANAEGMQGIVIGCFDDTALEQAVARSAVPVLGICQAACHVAALRGWRFSVVTTLAVSVPILEENIARYGFAPLLGRVRASDVPVLALEDDPDAAGARIAAELDRALAEDGIDAVILGCAGMAKLTADLRRRFALPILDGVESAARLLPAL
ncbi:MAG: aspartate/glutamate racemase family protein [Salipiger marinus]|uniref:aspartate/glutamate racemase family protein n=1 Tax=Salipiger marinus TaxID=555512 RepID=UPI00405893F8